MSSEDHAEAARELGRVARDYASDYSHKADRAATVAIISLTQSVLSLRDPLERLANAAERIAKQSEEFPL